MIGSERPPSRSRRRDVLRLAVGVGATWVLPGVSRPLFAVSATGTGIEIDISKIPPGSGIKVVWAGQPIFIRHLTGHEIGDAQAVPLADLRDPQTLEKRTQPGHRDWLVVIAVCPHLGCMPLGIGSGEPRGSWGGFLCPCHGSQFDTAGRVRAGPAPTNLEVPPYIFRSDGIIRLGT